MKNIGLVIAHTTSLSGAKNSEYNVTENEYSRVLVTMIADLIESKYQGKYNPVIIERPEPNHWRGEIDAINSTPALACVVSLHANAYNKQVAGCEMLYWKNSTKGKRLAQMLQDATYAVLRNPDRGIKGLDDGDRGVFIVRDTYPPTVVAEPFFIDNRIEWENYVNKQKALAHSILDAIITFIEGK